MGTRLMILAYVAERYEVDATPELINEIKTNGNGMSLRPIVGPDEDDTFLDYAELRGTDEDGNTTEETIEVLYDSRKQEAGQPDLRAAIMEIAGLTSVDEPLQFGDALADIQAICAKALQVLPAGVRQGDRRGRG